MKINWREQIQQKRYERSMPRWYWTLVEMIGVIISYCVIGFIMSFFVIWLALFFTDYIIDHPAFQDEWRKIECDLKNETS